jgi:hypothetical protein
MYQGADPNAIAGLLLQQEEGDPDDLGTPEPFPQPAPEEPEPDEKMLDMTQADILAQLHVDQLKAYVQASEFAQWKASNPATR